MRRWTTPTQRIVIHDVDLSNCDIYLTVNQGKNSVTFKSPIVSTSDADTILEFDLTQKDTSGFSVGTATIQINWVTPNNKRFATDTATIKITKNLLEREVTYGE